MSPNDRPVMTTAAKIPMRDWMRAPGTRKVIAALTAEGGDARFVGGCVRDALAGRPVKDIDIATHLAPEEVIRLLTQAGLKAIPTGIEHGTVTAVAEHKPFEITTLRVDVETYGRHAKVAFTDDWKADAARRDFTFNTLSATPDGKVYDYFNGLQDLNNRVIKFVGNARERIAEDRLRVLRFFRFIGVLGMTVERKTDMDACIAAREALTELSGERIRDELLKILASDMHFDVIRMMKDYRILEVILPEAGSPDALMRLKWLETTAIRFESVAPDAMRRLAVLLDTDAAGIEAVGDRLRLSNADKDRLRAMHDPGWQADPAIGDTDYERVLHALGPATAIDLILLEWARRLVQTPKLPSGETDTWQTLIAKAEAWEGKVFPLRGRDVLELGVDPGPEVSRLLDIVERWWEEGGFTADREACLARLKNVAAG